MKQGYLWRIMDRDERQQIIRELAGKYSFKPKKICGVPFMEGDGTVSTVVCVFPPDHETGHSWEEHYGKAD